jgi:hypothetical protein
LDECAEALGLSPRAAAIRLRGIGVKAGGRGSRTGQWDQVVTPEWLRRHIAEGMTLVQLRFAARDANGGSEVPDARTMRAYLDAYDLDTANAYLSADHGHLAASALAPIASMKLGRLGLNRKMLTDLSVRQRLGFEEVADKLGVGEADTIDALAKFGLLKPEDQTRFKASRLRPKTKPRANA